MKSIPFTIIFISLISGCTFFKSEFTPNDIVYTFNYFEYSDPDVSKTLYGVSAKKVVTCCNRIESKKVFDSYFFQKIKTAKETAVPSNLSQYKSEKNFLVVPHTDAPTGVVDGGTYVTNEEAQCVTLMRSIIKTGFISVKETGSNCSPLSKQ